MSLEMSHRFLIVSICVNLLKAFESMSSMDDEISSGCGFMEHTCVVLTMISFVWLRCITLYRFCFFTLMCLCDYSCS